MSRDSRDLISVVMPVWRPRPDWLLAAVGSVLGQTGCDLELIVIDDGNAEPVAPLLSGVSDRRLRLLRIDHAGQSAARNAGLVLARGQYVRYFDSDDVMPTDSTATLAALASGGEVISYGATQLCDEMLRPTGLMASHIEGDAVVDCLLGRFAVRCPAMLFPRRVAELTGPWSTEYSISEDWEYVLRAVEHAPVRGSREAVLYYRRNAGSTSRTATIARGEEAWRGIISGYFERHPEQRDTTLERQAKTALYLDKAAAYAHVGETRESLSRLAQAALLDPRRALSSGSRILVRSARRTWRRLVDSSPAG